MQFLLLFSTTAERREGLGRKHTNPKDLWRSFPLSSAATIAYISYFSGGELGRKAAALGPNSGDVHALLGLYLNAAGRPAEAIPVIQKAMRLSPYYPTFYLVQFGRAYRLTGRYEEAILEYKKLACRLPDSFFPYLGQALSYARLGQEKEARAAVAELLRVRPEYSLELHKGRAVLKGVELTRDLNNLRKAGVPE